MRHTLWFFLIIFLDNIGKEIGAKMILPFDSVSVLSSLLASLHVFSPNIASMVWCLGGVCFWNSLATMPLVLPQISKPLPLTLGSLLLFTLFGVDERKFKLKALTAARCWRRKISKFAKPAAAAAAEMALVGAADMSSLLSVSIVDELLLRTVWFATLSTKEKKIKGSKLSSRSLSPPYSLSLSSTRFIRRFRRTSFSLLQTVNKGRVTFWREKKDFYGDHDDFTYIWRLKLLYSSR